MDANFKEAPSVLLARLIAWLKDRFQRIRYNYWKWNQDWDVNVYIRYFPVVRFILRRSAGAFVSTLDVGSGSKGIAQFWKQGVIGVDLFDGQEEIANRLLPVTALAFVLPFHDRAFDHVVCVDMLEHIPEQYRTKTVIELLRVMKKDMVLAFPCGRAAEEKDRQSYQKARESGAVSRWLEDHIREGLPDEQRIGQILSADKTVRLVRKIRRDNIALIQIRDRVNATVLAKFRRIVLYPMVIASLIGWGECYRTYWFVERV